jgi:hypothetical protein
MDFTPYNNFPKPDNREAFGDEYRQWADDLDVLARNEGPIADRPTSAPTGAIYDATDQRVRYRYDGSSWAVIGGIGSAAKPLPSVNTEELSVSDVLDAPSYPTQADLPSNRPVGFIALIEDENRIYFEGA